MAKFDASLKESSSSSGPRNLKGGPAVIKDGWREVEVHIQVPVKYMSQTTKFQPSQYLVCISGPL